MLTADTSRPNAEIAAAWISWTERLDPGKPGNPSPSAEEEGDWGEQALLDLVIEDPLRALEIVFLIARSSGDEWLLSNLGAGPIESLLAEDATLLDGIALELQTNPALGTALASVWPLHMPDETRRALRRLVDN